MPTASLNGLNFHYEEHGAGFPIVLAHGYCASSTMWSHLTPILAKRYRTILYDARGHGLSTAPQGKDNYKLEHLVNDLVALLDHLEIDQAYIAGHSMGGATVQACAALHPQRVRATLICNIDGGFQPLDDESVSQVRALKEKNHALVQTRGLADYARQQLETQAAPAFVRDSPHERVAYLERYARQPMNGFLGVGEALPWRESWLKSTVDSLTGPVAIIAGDEDVMHVGAEALHDHLPESRFVSIQGAPHDSVNARPAALNQSVIDFLDAVENGTEIKGRFVV